MLSNHYHRTQRIGGLIHQELSSIFQCCISDPRLRALNITYVRISRDLGYADVGITRLISQGNDAEILKALKKASKRLRYLLAQRVNLRVTPMLRFHFDQFIVKSAALHAQIDQLMIDHEATTL